MWEGTGSKDTPANPIYDFIMQNECNYDYIYVNPLNLLIIYFLKTNLKKITMKCKNKNKKLFKVNFN